MQLRGWLPDDLAHRLGGLAHQQPGEIRPILRAELKPSRRPATTRPRRRPTTSTSTEPSSTSTAGTEARSGRRPTETTPRTNSTRSRTTTSTAPRARTRAGTKTRAVTGAEALSHLPGDFPRHHRLTRMLRQLRQPLPRTTTRCTLPTKRQRRRRGRPLTRSPTTTIGHHPRLRSHTTTGGTHPTGRRRRRQTTSRLRRHHRGGSRL